MSEYIWRKREVAAETSSRSEIIKKVLILYTGGTIGMKWNGTAGRNRDLVPPKSSSCCNNYRLPTCT